MSERGIDIGSQEFNNHHQIIIRYNCVYPKVQRMWSGRNATDHAMEEQNMIDHEG